jgi:hypothetical protein
MAFTSAITQTVPIAVGDKKMTFGTFTNAGGDTGGDINTGLKICDAIFLQTGGAAVNANDPSVNETLPCDGSAVTIVTTADQDGTWMAIGRDA